MYFYLSSGLNAFIDVVQEVSYIQVKEPFGCQVEFDRSKQVQVVVFGIGHKYVAVVLEVGTHSFGKVDGNKVFKNGKVGKDFKKVIFCFQFQ